jgi:uncharacterized protein YhbP (UPF0306 family)
MAALPPTLAQYLREHHVMTLATHSAEGPWAAALFYASDGSDLLFLSSPASRHGRDLARDAHCAATIQSQESDWARIRGVQLQGQAQPLEGEALARGQRLYAQKFPLVAPLGRMPAAIAAALARVRCYRLTPQRLWFIDNTRGFGHRDEIVPGSAR